MSSTDWEKYRLLNEGEIVLATDEILDDHGNWITSVNSVGSPAPDPRFTSHRKFRRLVTSERGKDEH